MSTLWGDKKTKSEWFGGACVAYGERPQTRSLGRIYGERLGGPIESEPFSEPLGLMTLPVAGDIALGHLGRTAAERADDRARDRAARVDATLASLGVRPRSRRSGPQ